MTEELLKEVVASFPADVPTVEELLKELSLKGVRIHETHIYDNPFEIVLLVSCSRRMGEKTFRAVSKTYLEALVEVKKYADS